MKSVLCIQTLALLLSVGGCKQSTCEDNEQATGDMDDTAPQGVCSSDTVSFSPQMVDTAGVGEAVSTAGGAGGATAAGLSETVASVLVRDGSMQPRALVNVDVFECSADSGAGSALEADNEQDVAGSTFGASATPLVQGSCVAVSATRLHCLTNYEGRAEFFLRFTTPTQGSVCADAVQKRETTTITKVRPLKIVNGGAGGAGGATSSTSGGAGGAGGATSTTSGGTGGAT